MTNTDKFPSFLILNFYLKIFYHEDIGISRIQFGEVRSSPLSSFNFPYLQRIILGIDFESDSLTVQDKNGFGIAAIPNNDCLSVKCSNVEIGVKYGHHCN